MSFAPRVPGVDEGGLLEFSVVFTDRSLNHMSKNFQKVMNDINNKLKQVYNCDQTVLIPGGGTAGMEAAARQFATDKKTLVLRNGLFSFRWTQIFDSDKIAKESVVLKAQKEKADDATSQWTPTPIEDAVKAIKAEKPDVVFTPHVETSAGIMWPDAEIKQLADAAHEVGALFVLDGIASGCVWVDMKALGVDVYLTAPQKGWSSTPCAGVVMLNQRALDVMEKTTSTSFALDLKKWHQIMKAYENGGHAYHITMPTDGLKQFRDAINEVEAMGFPEAKARQLDLGNKAVEVLAKHGFKSVAKPGYQAAGVIVCYTADDEIKSGKKFLQNGVQIAAGVPLQCDEGADFKTFRIGLFGQDKLKDVDATVAQLDAALKAATSA
eukprot:NODE_271_length_2346_cov_252.144101_g17_i15.p1 GENE.NODE_271_length_2346_cov_252.144101_g17_i15~~NODE_271_length_2346_cov_252.144101_g17_i15.p1  ORF type:complete len:381 (+),score=191.10 NODE_271_length_2346_cov_252.144101_g17_i15:120-1262(+)